QLSIRAALGSVAKQDSRGKRRPLGSEQCTEVGVRRDHDAALHGGPGEDFLIGGGLHAVLANVHGIGASSGEPFGQKRREGVVDQEPQATVLSGSSRSRTASAAYRSASVMSARSRSGYAARISS